MDKKLLFKIIFFICVHIFFPVASFSSEIANSLQFPMDNYLSEIIQTFGNHNPYYHCKKDSIEEAECITSKGLVCKQHTAEDIFGAAKTEETAGTRVYATGNGQVMFSRERGTCDDNWGHVLVVEHTLSDDSKFTSIYGHLDPSSILVEEGKPVTKGDPLGEIGHYSCWPDHLHFGVHLGPYGVAVGSYPSWLNGYLCPSEFPDDYVKPSEFIEQSHSNAKGQINSPKENQVIVDWEPCRDDPPPPPTFYGSGIISPEEGAVVKQATVVGQREEFLGNEPIYKESVGANIQSEKTFQFPIDPSSSEWWEIKYGSGKYRLALWIEPEGGKAFEADTVDFWYVNTSEKVNSATVGTAEVEGVFDGIIGGNSCKESIVAKFNDGTFSLNGNPDALEISASGNDVFIDYIPPDSRNGDFIMGDFISLHINFSGAPSPNPTSSLAWYSITDRACTLWAVGTPQIIFTKIGDQEGEQIAGYFQATLQAPSASLLATSGPSCPACFPEVCKDGIDNDCDELIDGNDPDCQTPNNPPKIESFDVQPRSAHVEWGGTYPFILTVEAQDPDGDSFTCQWYSNDAKLGDPLEEPCNPIEVRLGHHNQESTTHRVKVKVTDENDVSTESGEITVVVTSTQPSCGDESCNGSETQNTCCRDCGCPLGNQCVNNQCVSRCGNGACEPSQGETCSSCPQDCGVCPSCGDGVCNGDETQTSCCRDCGCALGNQCINNQCVSRCGNGTCELSQGETCSTCSQDCGCPEGQECIDNGCKPRCVPENCNDGIDNDCDGLIDANDPDCQSSIEILSCFVSPSTGTVNQTEFTWTMEAEGGRADIQANVIITNPVDGQDYEFKMDYVDDSHNPFAFTFEKTLLNVGTYYYRCKARSDLDTPVETQKYAGPMVSEKPPCGDGNCIGNENCASCPQDCGTCPPCGDGSCTGEETCSSCPQDCGVCQHKLTVKLDGQGTVNSNPAGIDCGNDCGQEYDEGTTVTLTGVSGSGWQFDKWSGDCSGKTNSTQITMNSDKSCEAHFSEIPPNQFRLTVNVFGQGTVNIKPPDVNCRNDGVNCSQTYIEDTEVTFTPTPDSGWKFDGWSGNADCHDEKVTMDSQKSCNASFSELPPEQKMLVVSIDGQGTVTSDPTGIDCGVDCSHEYTEGTVVTLTSAPDSDWTFDGWSDGCSGTTKTTQVTLDSDKSCTARFVRVFTLTVNPFGQGTVTSNPSGIKCGTGGNNCNQKYVEGNVIKLIPEPDPEWKFDGWSGNADCHDEQVTMDANKTCNAFFSEQCCNLASLPAVGTWQNDYGADFMCICDEPPGNTDCHAIYVGKVVTISGNQATLRFKKSEGGVPSSRVPYWIVVLGEEKLSCLELNNYEVRASGTWYPDIDGELETTVEVWPDQDACRKDLEGSIKRLGLITDENNQQPHEKIWFTKFPIVFTKQQCLSCSDQDKDGICDENDDCPTQPGPPNNGGCPNKCSKNNDCNDENECTVDACISNECSNDPVTAGTACDSGGQCNENRECVDCIDNNGCSSSKPVCKTSTNTCVECLNNSHCDDGTFCNGAETCNSDSNTCKPSPGNPCSGQCNETNDRCVACLKDSDCDDKNVCNGQEKCQNDSCVSGNSLNCDDQKVCTTDSCDPASGCQHTPSSEDCCDSNGNLRSSSYKCEEDITTEYYCKDGTACGLNVYVRHQDQYCSGNSAGCNGELKWDTAKVFDDCSPYQICNPGDSSCDNIQEFTIINTGRSCYTNYEDDKALCIQLKFKPESDHEAQAIITKKDFSSWSGHIMLEIWNKDSNTLLWDSTLCLYVEGLTTLETDWFDFRNADISGTDDIHGRIWSPCADGPIRYTGNLAVTDNCD